MSEREPILCNARNPDGCMKHEGLTLCDGSQCKGGIWENRSIAPHIIRVEPCNGEGMIVDDVEEQIQPEE